MSETMKIYTKSLPDGAKKAKGTAIVIDIFRAGTTIPTLFYVGVESIIVVQYLKDARQLKRETGYEIIGEIRGFPPKDFKCGNSPYEVSKLKDLKGKTVVFRSSACSIGIINALEAGVDELLVGSFSNASTIIDYIKKKKPDEVTLIPIGTVGFGPDRKAVEDEKCAEYIKESLEGEQPDFPQMIKEIKKGGSKKEGGYERLLKFGQEKDIEPCLTIDLYDILPIVTREGDRIIIQKLL